MRSFLLGCTLAALAMLLPTSAVGAAPNSAAPNSVGIYGAWEYVDNTYSISGLSNATEQVTVAGSFTSPTGASRPYPGFYYGPASGSNGDFRVRFPPNELGTWSYNVTISGGPGGTHTDSGTFLVVDDPVQHGWVKRSATDPHRFVFSKDNTIAAMIGWNAPILCFNCGGAGSPYQMDIGCALENCPSGDQAYDPTHPTGMTVQQFDAIMGANGGYGYNWYRTILCNGGNGCPFSSISTPVSQGGSGNTYHFTDGDFSPPGALPSLDMILADQHANGFHIELGLFAVPWLGPDAVPVAGTAYGNAAKYVFARWGAYADTFEVNNEAGGGQAWHQGMANYIRSIDPYRRMVTNNYSNEGGTAADGSYMDFGTIHERVRNQDAMGFVNLANFNGQNNYPAVIDELYANPNVPNHTGECDDDGFRFLSWQSFFAGLAVVPWFSDGGGSGCGQRVAVVNLVATLAANRANQVLAQTFNDGAFVDGVTITHPTANWTPSNNNGAGVWTAGGAGQGKVVIWGGSGPDDQTSYTFSTSYDFAFAGSGQWIDTRNGNVIATQTISGGNQGITSPPFTKDIAFVVASGGPVATPTPAAAATSTPIPQSATDTPVAAVATSTPLPPAVSTATPLPPALSTPTPRPSAGPALTPVALASFVSDSFTGADGDTIDSHSPGVGGAWSSAPALKLMNNHLSADGFGFGLSANAARPSSADYDVAADLIWSGAASHGRNGVAGRLTVDGHSAYEATYDGSSGLWRLELWENGNESTLGVFGQVYVQGETHKVKLSMRGAAITVLVDGVSRITTSDSAISAAGLSGVDIGGEFNNTDVYLDTFLATSPGVVAAATDTPTVSTATPVPVDTATPVPANTATAVIRQTCFEILAYDRTPTAYTRPISECSNQS